MEERLEQAIANFNRQTRNRLMKLVMLDEINEILGRRLLPPPGLETGWINSGADAFEAPMFNVQIK